MVARIVLRGIEPTAGGGLEAEGREETRGDAQGVKVDGRPALRRESVTPLAEGSDVGETLGFAREIGKIRRGMITGLRLRIGPVNADEPFAVRIGQRFQDQQVHQAEHRGVQADAEGQGDQGDGGEAGRLGELTESKFEIGEHGIEAGSRERGAGSLKIILVLLLVLVISELVSSDCGRKRKSTRRRTRGAFSDVRSIFPWQQVGQEEEQADDRPG